MAEEKRDLYQELGVSSSKDGVHKAIKDLDKGLFPGAFCKILPAPTMLDKEGDYVSVMHSDGAGTKSNVAYLMKMEGYEDYLERFSDLAQDVAVMNIDDMAAVGICDNIYLSNHIGRNANRISDEDIAAVINGYSNFIEKMKRYGVNIIETGGETADVGSYITTMGLDAVTSGYMLKSDVIDCSNIKPGAYIVGLSSYGQSEYEEKYNSGIRSNGLTLAINSMLSPKYRKYTEAMDMTLCEHQVFRGPYSLEDKLEGTPLTVGEALLSPTRTYTPIIREIMKYHLGTEKDEIDIQGIIHCSGGGATKCSKFGKGIHYIKNDIIDVPPLFKAIQETEDISSENMFKTFNMGTGMELIVGNIEDAKCGIEVAESFGVEAKIIGRTAKNKDANSNKVTIVHKGEVLNYE